MRLGYLGIAFACAASRASFNEAEAHAPRIQALPGHHNTCWRGFNEAEAHAPRIQHFPRPSAMGGTKLQ